MTCMEYARRLRKSVYLSEASWSVSAGSLEGIMMHSSRLTLFSTAAISLGGIAFLGALAGEAISGGGGAMMGAARATVASPSSSWDFPICHTPAAAERTNTVLRLAQTRTEVPKTEMKAAMPAPAIADSAPPLWDGLGSITFKISTSSAEAQA